MKKSGLVSGSKTNSQSRVTLYWKGFIASSANPKAVVFFAALFPQFVNPDLPTANQFVILGLTYIVIDGCFLMFYGLTSNWILNRFEKHLDKYLNRASGSLLIGSAILLGLKDIRES
jgi:threonine/homoserine/homoserine lactone efflux protein